MSKLFALLMLSCFVFGKANTSVINIKFTNFDADVNIVVDKMLDEIRIVQFIHNKLNNNIEHKIDLINNNLLSERNLEKKVNYLIEKDQLKDELIKSKIVINIRLMIQNNFFKLDFCLGS